MAELLYPRANSVQPSLRKIVVNTRRAAVAALHFLKDARWEEPLVQVDATNAKRVIDVLIRAGAEPIDGYSKTMNT